MKTWVREAVSAQPNLFDSDKRFEEYHKANPEVYRLFCTFALQLIHAGAKHIGSKAVMERLRFESAVRGRESAFKVNNNWTPHYARLFEKDHPEHAGVFERRRSKADAELGLEG